MKKITTYCDICEKQAKEGDIYAVDIKWWSDTGYHRYDVCGDCKDEAEKDIKNKRPHEQRNRLFLGLLRKIFKNKTA